MNSDLFRMQTPVLSIIVPTYNSELTIRVCLESIKNQTFRLFEVIIVDGLSTDETIEIVKQYANEFPAIKYQSEKDYGIYDAMNKGIRLAKGEWIYFLGSDDYLINEFVLEEVTKWIDLNMYDFVYGNVILRTLGEKHDGEFTVKKYLKKNICHQAIFVRKEIFYLLGMFNCDYKVSADHDFNLKCFLNMNIRKKYIDLNIAYYESTGFSSYSFDNKFYRDYNFLLARYGSDYFNWVQRLYFIIKGWLGFIYRPYLNIKPKWFTPIVWGKRLVGK